MEKAKNFAGVVFHEDPYELSEIHAALVCTSGVCLRLDGRAGKLMAGMVGHAGISTCHMADLGFEYFSFGAVMFSAPPFSRILP